jgi:mannose-1-phosphate guanylyltransferase
MGTSLEPLTGELPKPMVPIMNKPLLERSMNDFQRSGINEMVISTCYKSKYIKEYFVDGSKFSLLPTALSDMIKTNVRFFLQKSQTVIGNDVSIPMGSTVVDSVIWIM